MKLLNAFSLNMVSDGTLSIETIGVEDARSILTQHGIESFVGHSPEAIAHALGLPVALNRQSTTLAAGERAIIAQYTGPRLPEGATTLPQGAVIAFKLVTWTPAKEG